jgi:hypothetical protein
VKHSNRVALNLTLTLIIIILISAQSVNSVLEAHQTLSTSGLITYETTNDPDPVNIDPSSEYILVDADNIIGTNRLSLGFQLDGRDINSWRTSTTLQNLAKEANFKIVRFFPQRLSTGDPCTGWNPPTWNWGPMDDLVDKIIAIGAKPMPVLGFCGSSGWSSPPNVPNNADDFAEYCREWVKHYGNKIQIYEIINEPHHGFSHGAFDAQEFVDIYTTAARAMKQENPNILVGNDNSMITWSQGGVSNWRNYFATQINTNDIDFLSLHRYITGSMSESDASLISKSETNEGCTYGSTTLIQSARQYYNSEGYGLLPVIQSEGNLNYGFSSGTDPRIQETINAVSHALSFKMLAEKGYVTYNIFFDFAGSGRSSTKFGMINRDNNTPWPVYYVQWMLGNNLAVGDKIVQSTDTNAVSSLAWINNGKLKIMLTNKTPQTSTITLSGTDGPFTIQRLDSSRNGLTTETTSTNQITLNGYTVLLISPQQSEVTTPQESNQDSNQESPYVPDEEPVSSSAASISATSEAYVDSSVTFDGSASNDANDYVRYYRWDFGDGTRAYGKTATHTYSTTGTYTVTLTIRYKNRERETTTHQITISNQDSSSTSTSSSNSYSDNNSYSSYRSYSSYSSYSSYRHYRRR